MQTRTQVVVVAAVLLGAVSARGHEHDMAPAPAHANPAWDRMKKLVGSWAGTMDDSGTKGPATTSFRVVSGGSALLSLIGEGSPYEMVTMFHLDLGELRATHYCSAGNQPRFKAAHAESPDKIVFDFTDGTNIAPGDGHMQRVIFTFDGDDHHTEDWVFLDKGKESTGHFDFRRKK